MEPARDADPRLALLRASARDRLHQSDDLISRARRSARSHAASARRMYGRAEQQFARSLRQRPPLYDALIRDQQRPRAEVLAAVLDVAGSIYPGYQSISLTAVSAVGAGPSLRYATLAHTGTAAVADAAQYALDEGPCLEAIALNQVTVVGSDDLWGDTSVWSRFSAAARHLGVRSAISVGIPWTRHWTGPPSSECPPVAAINIYSATPYPFLTLETEALKLGVHVGARLTGAHPAELYAGA